MPLEASQTEAGPRKSPRENVQGAALSQAELQSWQRYQQALAQSITAQKIVQGAKRLEHAGQIILDGKGEDSFV